MASGQEATKSKEELETFILLDTYCTFPDPIHPHLSAPNRNAIGPQSMGLRHHENPYWWTDDTQSTGAWRSWSWSTTPLHQDSILQDRFTCYTQDFYSPSDTSKLPEESCICPYNVRYSPKIRPATAQDPSHQGTSFPLSAANHFLVLTVEGPRSSCKGPERDQRSSMCLRDFTVIASELADICLVSGPHTRRCSTGYFYHISHLES